MDEKNRTFLRQLVRGKIEFDPNVAQKTTLRIGGKADAWMEPESSVELAEVLRFCTEQTIPFTLVGNGSNLLIQDGGYRGVLIRLTGGEFKTLAVKENKLFCGAGVGLNELLHELREHALCGGEFLTGIPGTVGGALRMNAGAHGGSIADITESVTVMTREGEILEKKKEEIEFHYRNVPFFQDKVILKAVLSFSFGKAKQIRAKMSDFSRERSRVTPPHFNAGCIFKNPNGFSAGKLIDEAGLKGEKVGGIQVSLTHGNYFVNLGNGSSRDVLALMEKVRQTVKQVHGLALEPEIRIIGEK